MSNQRMFEYEVEGKGRFPLDMLRYDQCWPADPSSVGLIDNDVRKHRVVKLRGLKMPTTPRWVSFLWSVRRDTIRPC